MPAAPSLELAIARHRAGARDEAEQLYRAVLEASPAQSTANHNLAILLSERGAAQEALAHFHAALQAEPSQGHYWLSYAKALLIAGRRSEAVDLLEKGKAGGLTGAIVEALLTEARRSPSDDDETRGYRLAEEGRFAEATAAFRQALKRNPDNAGLYLACARAMSENGDIAESFAAYMRHAELAAAAGETESPLHRMHHDQAQRDHLVMLGLAAPDAQAGQLFHLAPGERLEGPAVNSANATPALLESWNRHQPQMVVIENFLMPEALEKLRRYCAQSTVWKRNYAAGYIGAMLQDGFACPLLAQIAEEIRETYAPILAPHALHYLGAFKYDSQLSTGTNIHADFSAVNVNFYIAPDEGNLDPASGGMRIWNVEARDETQLRHLNSDEAAATAHVKDAPVTIVPHKANRAVFFKSALFHKTDDCHFADGYLNMRINISLLFGRFGAAGGQHARQLCDARTE